MREKKGFRFKRTLFLIVKDGEKERIDTGTRGEERWGSLPEVGRCRCRGHLVSRFGTSLRYSRRRGGGPLATDDPRSTPWTGGGRGAGTSGYPPRLGSSGLEPTSTQMRCRG